MELARRSPPVKAGRASCDMIFPKPAGFGRFKSTPNLAMQKECRMAAFSPQSRFPGMGETRSPLIRAMVS